MMLLSKMLSPAAARLRRTSLAFTNSDLDIKRRGICSYPEGSDFVDYLDSLNNYEKSGVPRGAGTDSDDGFDLGRMHRLMDRLGNPQSNFKTVHIAGTKGKGSTATFLSNILRAEGYSVGSYTSPHVQTIRERISLGRNGEPVSVELLNSSFKRNKIFFDRAMELENGHMSHFEVLTALAFMLFSEEDVDIAVIEAGLGGARDATNILCSSGLAASVITTIGEEHLAALGGSLESIAVAKSGIIKQGRPLVLGGPFLPHVEGILRSKASSLSSPVVSATDTGNRSTLKGIEIFDGKPYQYCDIKIQLEGSFQLSIELCDVRLRMIGTHQLQNAATATCAALCLREQGWRISDRSIRAGLEQTHMLGRGQFLTPKEAEALGLDGTTVVLDGAHTKDSVRALLHTIQMVIPDALVALVVAMASDKDHLGFARESFSSQRLEATLLTEVDIAGSKLRTARASSLRDSWVQASQELRISIVHDGMPEYSQLLEEPFTGSEHKTVLAAENSLLTSMMVGNQILKARQRDRPGVVAVTGSLHAVSSVLNSLHG